MRGVLSIEMVVMNKKSRCWDGFVIDRSIYTKLMWVVGSGFGVSKSGCMKAVNCMELQYRNR
jgi:subtilase family serine protease